MAQGRIAAVAPYLERVAVNEYVQDRLFEAARQLQGAYARASGRSARKAAQDRRVQARVKRALEAGRDAAVAVRTGRKRKRRWVRPVVIAGVAAAAVGACVAASGPVRRRFADRESGRDESPPDVTVTAPATPSAAE
jgi:hypothetical protein